jgi:RNA exonuclease NGL2
MNSPPLVDFNTQPTESTYSLIVNEPLTKAHLDGLAASRVVHVTRDSTVPKTPATQGTNKDDDEEGGANGTIKDEEDKDNDKDREITNTRPAIPNDELMDDEELQRLFAIDDNSTLTSAYAAGLPKVAGEADNLFGARNRSWFGKGYSEPMWTSFTHYWRLTLGKRYCNYIIPYSLSQVSYL